MKKNVENDENKEDKRLKNSGFINAWENAIKGIIYAVTTQGNIRKQLAIAVIVMLISLFFNLSRAEFLCLMFTIILIIVVEMINTAIETVVDLYTELYHPKAKIAKDVGAGAVVISVINALIVAYFLFFDKISDIGLAFLENIANNPVHLTFIAVFITIILIVTVKAASTTNKHKFIKQNFMPSGQAGLAFAGLTVIWMNTRNIIILTLSFVLAIAVAENRIEAKKRTLSEVIAGATLGILVTIFIFGLAKVFLRIF